MNEEELRTLRIGHLESERREWFEGRRIWWGTDCKRRKRTERKPEKQITIV